MGAIDYAALAEAIDAVVEVAVSVRSRFEAEGFSSYACEEFALMFVGNLLLDGGGD